MKGLEWTHRVTMSGSIVVVKERKGQLGNNEKRVRSHVRCDITPTAISGAGQLHLYKFQKKTNRTVNKTCSSTAPRNRTVHRHPPSTQICSFPVHLCLHPPSMCHVANSVQMLNWRWSQPSNVRALLPETLPH